MGNYELLKAAINEVIKANGRQEITGEVLNQVLLSMVNSLGAGYQCMGVATPSTNPGTPDQNVFYFATQAGTYTNFGAIVLQEGISVLIWDGDWASQTWFTVDSAPTNNSQNLIASGAVFNALKLDGGAYDVSAHNSGATFASLSALLNSANLNTLIPVEIRHGGMSVKFVQSSDNKYVQFRLKTTYFSTNVLDWESVIELRNAINNGTYIPSIIDGEYYEADGSIALYGSWSRIDYIDIEGLTALKVHSDYPLNNNIFFDSNKQKIILFSLVAGDQTIAVPNNTKYVGFSGATSQIGSVTIQSISVAKITEPIEKILDANSSLVKCLCDILGVNSLPISMSVDGYTMDTDGLFMDDARYVAVCYDVSKLKKVYIINNSDAPTKYQFQSTQNTPVSGTNTYLVGTPVTTKTNEEIIVPEGAKYLFVAKRTNNDLVTGAYDCSIKTDYTLSEGGVAADAKAVGERFDDIAKQIESVLLYATNIHINDPHFYVVGANQTYTTITSAYDQWVADGKPYGIIKVLPGVYEESLDTGALVNNNRLCIIGESKESTIWKMTDANYDYPPLSCSGNITIRNISFIVDKTNSWETGAGAYAIHIDNPNGKGCVILEDVYAESTLNSAIGCGTRTDQQIVLKNVTLEHPAEESWAGSTGVNNGALLYHTSATPNSPNQSLYMENVKAHSIGGPGMQILSAGDGNTDVPATFRFCIAHSDYYETYDGGRYRENKVVIQNNNERIKISEDSMFNNSYKLNYS